MNNSDYSEVYSWFEKSGIISNIRTHLRQNLVNALKSNTHSRDGKKADLRSAKQYIHDMLIAEYLLSYNYAYTLSVFASEAPLLINLQHSSKVSPVNDGKKAKTKLPHDYVCHTLQTLGINPKSSEGKDILSQYAVSEAPLILCILRFLMSYFSKKFLLENDGETNVGIQDRGTQTDFLESTESRESVILSDAKEKLYQQKDLFANQLKNKELELKEQALFMEQQLASLNQKLEHAQNLMHFVDAKENNLAREKLKNEQILARKELELSVKEKLLTQETDRLQKERDSYRTFEGDMRKLKEELAKVRNELPGMSTNLSEIKQEASVQTHICDIAINAENIRLLNEEKQELSSLVREQQSRIEELTLRAITLARQLEEAQLLLSPDINLSSNSIKHVNINVNTVFSESSSTEDILQDAKMRLRRLEEESLRAEQYFYNCITTSP